MDSYAAHRSRSHSRFPPDDFPSLDRSQRSKSLDNRQQPFGGNPQRHSRMDGEGRGLRDEFFNDTITIPIQNQPFPHHHYQQQQHHHRAEGMHEGLGQQTLNYGSAAENDFETYNRSVKQNHERTVYPQTQRENQQRQYLSESWGAGAGNQADYAAQDRRMQGEESYTAAGGTAGGMSTFGRSAAARSGGHSRSHHREYHYQSGGGGARSYHNQQQQQHLANGASGWTTAHSAGFAHGRRQLSGPPIVHHKVNCCCFSFKWPPWSYEECPPPRPFFYTDPKSMRAGARPVTAAPLHPINTSTLPPPQAAPGRPSPPDY